MSRALTYAAVALVLLPCCSRRVKEVRVEVPVPVESVSRELRVEYRAQHDSVYERDSVVTDLRRDTVRVERWHRSERVRSLHDTVAVVRRDTVREAVEVVREVSVPDVRERRGGGWWAAVAVAVAVAALLLAAVWLLRRR